MKTFFYTLLALGSLNLTAPAQTNKLMNTNKTEIADFGGG